MATHSSLPAWRIPWTEDLVGYSRWGRRESDTTEVTEHVRTQSVSEATFKIGQRWGVVMRVERVHHAMLSGPKCLLKAIPRHPPLLILCKGKDLKHRFLPDSRIGSP